MDYIFPTHIISAPDYIPHIAKTHSAPLEVNTVFFPHIGQMHWHNYTQIWYLQTGSYSQIFNEKKHRLSPGHLLIFPPYFVHQVDLSNIDVNSISLFKINIYEDLYDKSVFPYNPLTHSLSVFENTVVPIQFRFSGKEKLRIDTLFNDIANSFISTNGMDSKKIFSKLTEIFVCLCRHSSEQLSKAKTIQLVENSRLINESATFIDVNFKNKLSISDVATHISLSPTAFGNKFKFHTGQTVYSYCMAFRINAAMRMLSYTNMTINDIAENCGFYDGMHLSHQIKRLCKISPTTFRTKALELENLYGSFINSYYAEKNSHLREIYLRRL